MNALTEPIPTTDVSQQTDQAEPEQLDGSSEEQTVGAESSWVQSQLNALLRLHVTQARLGHVFDAECGYACFPDRPKTVRKPDVSFVRRGRFPDGRVPGGWIQIVPDLATEVVSQDDNAEAVELKIADFLSAGVQLLWVVYPKTQSVYAHSADGTVRRLTAADTLTGDPVVPGFRVPVFELFPPAEEPTIPADPA